MIRAPHLPLRRGLVLAEFVILAGLNIEQAVRLALRHAQPETGGLLYFAVGLAIGVLTVLRHRFPGRMTELAASAIVLSLVCSGIGFLARPAANLAGDPETLALMLVTGASCHRLAPRWAGGLAVLGGIAIALGPGLRYGGGSTTLTLAVLWAMLWGASVVVGLILRDGDTRREAALAAARDRERLALARELHDLVAHHITGVVVRAQAAGVVVGDGSDQRLLQDIERAGTEALAAMRRLVTMLRSPEQPLAPTGGLRETVEAAVGGDDTVALRLAPELADLTVEPETVSTVHRVVLESLTNVRKHAPDAHRTVVTVEPATDAERRYLRVEVLNDGLRHGRNHRAADGYGLVGMGERIAALDGRLTAGEHGDHGWRVLAELPLPGGVAQSRPSEGGMAR